MKKINLRLNVTEGERDHIRRAAALAGARSMAEFSRTAILLAADLVERAAGIPDYRPPSMPKQTTEEQPI